MIRIKLTSVFVDDQAKALEFYTKVLGLEKKADRPPGATRKPSSRPGCPRRCSRSTTSTSSTSE